jgi:two-component system chemotaxis response regulator CheB
VELIAIASSTGGPGVLREILSALPGDMSIPIAAVQHITPGFSHGFAQWLDGATMIKVTIAEHNEPLTPGRALIAPDDTHMTVAPGGIIHLDQSPPVKGLRPSATRLFNSAAEVCGTGTVGIVLTGMGEDGADGLENLRRAGGRVIAQNEASCVVYGMPKAAIERNLADHVLAPDKIASVLNHLDVEHKRNQ